MSTFNLLGGKKLMGESQHKAVKGIIKISVNTDRKIIRWINISGDFFLYPEDMLWELEKKLVGVNTDEVLTTIREFYKEKGIVSPGVTPKDFAEAIKKATG